MSPTPEVQDLAWWVPRHLREQNLKNDFIFGQSSPWIYFNKNGMRFEFSVGRLFSQGPFLRQSSGKKQHLAK